MEAQDAGILPSGPQNAEAGPSRMSSSKQVNLRGESSDDESVSDGRRTNGVRVNGSTKRKRGGRDEGSRSDWQSNRMSQQEAMHRKRVAAELLETRKALPFYQGKLSRTKIIEEIMRHDTTIILGETGCGKSTQLPQLLRTHPLSRAHYSPTVPTTDHRSRQGPSIAITQPRRLPAIALANRVAAEMGCLPGGEVGYAVRFDEAVTRMTRVKYMTEGVLMRELAGIRDSSVTEDDQIESDKDASMSGAGSQLDLLLRYDVVVVDEAHERTLNTDFLCGALSRIQKTRREIVHRQSMANGHASKPLDVKGNGKQDHTKIRELKIVIMSATLDPSKFVRFFNTGREALLVKGRMFDVHVHHLRDSPDDYIAMAARQVMQIHCAKPERDGDILIFMPGSEEIEDLVASLRETAKQLPETYMGMQVLPLYSSLPQNAQAKIFAPLGENTRRVIVATNIAETSLTIPGVVHVVDTGYKKEKQYIFRNSGSMEHLKKMPISKASAWQRTGRAGRERAGECYRLYTQAAFEGLATFDEPEIQRVSLESAVLQLVAMGINPFEFEYIDSPGLDPIKAALQSLAGLGALESTSSITSLGKQMLHYPLDPPKARILIASFDLGCISEIIDLLSLIDAGHLFVDRASERDSLAEARSKYVSPEGDHLTNLHVFRTFVDIKEKGKAGEGLSKWCRDNHVNHRTLTNAVKVRDQLRDLVHRQGKDWRTSCGSENAVVLKSLLQGSYMNTAVIQADGTYKQTLGGLPVKIHPSSVLMSKKVPAILFDELVITNNIYARGVSAIDHQWLAEVPFFKNAVNTRAIAAPSDNARI